MTNAKPEIYITSLSSLWDETAVTPLVERALEACTVLDDFSDHNVSIVLGDDLEIQGLNKQFRGFDKPTNVLSFPADEDDFVPEGELQPLGDIILAYETIQREALEQDKLFDHHLTHLIVHGFLHLLGYDHEEDVEAEEMEALEIQILASLGIKDPYNT